ncbi:hypothetical protein D3C80_342090 [compost metagenome]
MNEFRQLRHENEDCKRIDEAGDDRARYKTHQASELEEACKDLQNAHQDRGCKEILQTVFLDERDHHHSSCSGCSRDHARTSTSEGGNTGNGERGEEADLGVDACDNRKADGFRDKSKRYDDAGENIAANIGEPLAAVGSKTCH